MCRVLLLILVVVMSSVATVHAGVTDGTVKLFGSIPAQFTEYGKHWQLHLRIPFRDGVPARIAASHLPEGAGMRIVDERWIVLDWRPSSTQSGQYHLTLSAQFDGENQARYFRVVDVMVKGHEKPIRTRPVRVAPVRKAASIPLVASNPEPSTRPIDEESIANQGALEDTIEQAVSMIDSAGNTATTARADVASDASAAATAMLAPAALAMRRPRLEPMATQIVSVGRTVSFDLRPTVADGRIAAVHVDRLPRSASFERNPDGSRTFFWRTGHRDQGEHVFRFTANHPDDPALISFSEAVIIVGDPSLGGTEPQLPAPRIEAHDNDANPAEARTMNIENAEAPLASSDPFSENFDPTLDRDLDADFDELDESDVWEEPELR